MDRNVQVFVYDKNHKPINGPKITFRVGDTVIGYTADANGRASTQVPAEHSDAIVSVEANYRGHKLEAKLARGTETYDFVYDFAVGSSFAQDYLPPVLA